MAMPKGPGYTGLRCAPVLWWRAFGIIESKLLKARHYSTNPSYPYRDKRFTITDSRFTTLKLVAVTALSQVSLV